MRRVHKIAISMSGDTLRLLDEAVAGSELSRSGFIQRAVERYLKQQEHERIQASIDSVFAEENAVSEQRQDSERFLAASSLPEEQW